MWLYGSGFPKSHNIGKAVDKLEGNEREVVGLKTDGAYSAGTNNLGIKQQIKNGEDGRKTLPSRGEDFGKITKGQSEYEGWGTALKPANEPICLARKPLSEKSIAENVLRWGTGGINIDGCRVESDDKLKEHINKYGKDSDYGIESKTSFGQIKSNVIFGNNEGRFPANIILDEEAGKILDEQSGFSKTSRFFYQAKVSKKVRNMGLDSFEDKVLKSNQINVDKINGREVSNPKESIVKNTHPTLKPINLMTYLCRLITPKGGIVLDPFMGSGSTGISALLEGFKFVGMEMDSEYFKIAEARIMNWEKYSEFIK
jgi:site-specific DNA-methyltransferase (adenine-specific)